MTTHNYLQGLVLAFLCCVLHSCSKSVFETEETDEEKVYTIRPQIQVNDPWSASTRADVVIGATDPIFMCYLFNEEGTCLMNRGDLLKASNNHVTFRDATEFGKYTIYCVTGWYKTEYPRTTDPNITINKETLLNMFSPKDICLGKAEVEINPDRLNYDVNITVDHIMAKVGFYINNVSSLVTDISVTLPNQANQFTFEGEIIGDSQSQTLTLQKSTNTNSNGTHNWFVDETIVYPYASKTGNIPIIVSATLNDTTYTFYTQSDSLCNEGTHIEYSSDWVKITKAMNTQIVTKPWTEDVKKANFDLGTPKTNQNQ